MQGSVVPAITPKILGAVAIGVFAELVNYGLLGDTARSAVNYTFAPFTALGVAISLFLGFHNNASYSRWWEARTLWGNQIIVVRNLIRFLLGICRSNHHKQQRHVSVVENIPDSNEERSKKTSSSTSNMIALSEDDWRFRVIRLAMAQTHAMRSQLRPTCRADTPLTAQQDRDRFLTEEERHTLCQSPNPASAILLRMATILGEESELPEYSLIRASQIIDDLCAIQTGCERIHNTTIPFAYSLLVHRTSSFYVILAPFAMVGSMAWWTPVFSGILAYTFFGLDEGAFVCITSEIKAFVTLVLTTYHPIFHHFYFCNSGTTDPRTIWGRTAVLGSVCHVPRC